MNHHHSMILQKKVISLELAKIIADGAKKAAADKGIHIAVSIMNTEGNLVLFEKMDGAPWGSVRIAQLKSTTSASAPMSTRVVAQVNEEVDPHGQFSGGAIPGITFGYGGLPILTSEGEHIGSIGVSGASGDMDEACAQAGLDAAASRLKSPAKAL